MDDDARCRSGALLASHGSAVGLSLLLGAAGVTHFVRPEVFESLIPRPLGSPRAWVLGSGAAELTCAVAVAVPRTRRLGALASAALFIVVFPGNVTMAVRSRAGAQSWTGRPAAGWGRLPLQVPLVWWALAVARRAAAPADADR